eukprot:Blabericola_migrator_1__2831@NODE_180_length_11882_cov_134_948540_g18_i1_p1_GENE_NODE_180_length_11882_cov_134_948540_g18_i1NODE_180_length_11882_cov_134_948540_g18_i1_p1_ORF_typecomplete_len1125_score174_39SET/PF00856_28/2_6e13_NODE_180_length_11882_cov_134_948540_g18_i112414615
MKESAALKMLFPEEPVQQKSIEESAVPNMLMLFPEDTAGAKPANQRSAPAKPSIEEFGAMKLMGSALKESMILEAKATTSMRQMEEDKPATHTEFPGSEDETATSVVDHSVLSLGHRELKIMTLSEYLKRLWDLALTETIEGSPALPKTAVILKDLMKDLDLSRFGPDAEATSYKGIKIRLEDRIHPRMPLMKATPMSYRLGVNPRTGWITVALPHNTGKDNAFIKRRLVTQYGRLNLVSCEIGSLNLPENCILFLPRYKPLRRHSLLGELSATNPEDSSDDNAADPICLEHWKRHCDDSRMARWMDPRNRQWWWKIEETSLDCDGFNEEFNVPAALGYDLTVIKHAVRGDPKAQSLAADPHFRSRVYSEVEANRRMEAIESEFEFVEVTDMASSEEPSKESLAQQSQSAEPPPALASMESKPAELRAVPSPPAETSMVVASLPPAQKVSQPFDLDSIRIPRKKRKIDTDPQIDLPGGQSLGAATPPTSQVSLVASQRSPPTGQLSPPPSPSAESTGAVTAASTAAPSAAPSAPSKSETEASCQLARRRLKRQREDATEEVPTAITSGDGNHCMPVTSHSSMEASSVTSSTLQVVAKLNNGERFSENFKHLPYQLIGRSLWWIFALGIPGIEKRFLAKHGPTILYNLLYFKRDWNKVVAGMLSDYRSIAEKDERLNEPQTIAAVDAFLAQMKKNPSGIRIQRLSVLRRKQEKTLLYNLLAPATLTAIHTVSPPELPTSPPVTSNLDPLDDPEYNKKICDLVGRRTALYYSKERYYRPFHETRIVLCKCTRCRTRFRNTLSVGDDEVIRDIDSTVQDSSQLAESPTGLEDKVAESPEEAELLADLRSLSVETLDGWVTTTRELRPHSHNTIEALAHLLTKCVGIQCGMSSGVRAELTANMSKWTGLVSTSSSSAESKQVYQKRSRRDRSSYVNEGDVEEMKKAFFDEDCFPIRSAYRLNFLARKSLYRMCAINDWLAPILIAQNEKGRAVFAAAVIYKGDFVCEYKGVFYGQYGLAKAKEKDYTLLGKGSFMFYFPNPCTGSTSCIDATAECPKFGPARLINHSHRRPNLEATLVTSDDGRHHDKERRARLIFFASRDIRIGEELLIDYGETKLETLQQNAWLYD